MQNIHSYSIFLLNYIIHNNSWSSVMLAAWGCGHTCGHSCAIHAQCLCHPCCVSPSVAARAFHSVTAWGGCVVPVWPFDHLPTPKPCLFVWLSVPPPRSPLQLPGPVPSHQQATFGSAFLLDVHMDSGRLLKPWVSSLGAFWPAMQVLAGKLLLELTAGLRVILIAPTLALRDCGT